MGEPTHDSPENAMSRDEIDLSLLPEEGRKSLRNYYELLLERYRDRSEDSDEFDPTEYRGSIDVDREAEKKLESLRDEWSRDVR